MWRFRVGSLAITLMLACGGRAQIDGLSDAPSVSAGTGGATGAGAAGSRAGTSAGGAASTMGGAAAAVAGSGAGAAVAGSGGGSTEADSDLSNSCPQAPSACPTTEVDLRFTRDAAGPRREVWVEPLQIPDYPVEAPTHSPEVDPSQWDRSPLPAGACVLRIHGLSGACLRRGLLHVGTCAALADPEASHVVPFGYYEGSACEDGIAPGCPSAAASDSRSGFWWYLMARGQDTDLVVCAAECKTTFGSEKHACLRLGGAE